MIFDTTKVQSSASRDSVSLSIIQERPRQFNVWEELQELHRTPEWQDGNARKVLVQYPDLQITLRAMKANNRIPKHHNPGRVCVQVVQGHIRIHAGDELFDVPQGMMLILDPGTIHDVEAFEESVFLLIVVPPKA
jgi:quercetin dioxygenase-like cupin family protein